ncbi:MAG TPA: hypothetical protein VNV88_12395 [Candidatus Solibacter sp.]|jgi:Icc-related predicted phosphoesterase|nr:hypothetical protein [Candidatus Solibacter sp.]
MRKAIAKILATSRPSGNIDAIRRLGQEAVSAGADAIVLLGSLTLKGTGPRTVGQVLKALGEAHLPAFYVPGPDDTPFLEFLREAANFELVYPQLRGVHGTFALVHGQVVVSGMGGMIEDGPATLHNEVEILRYPGWEVEYRLKFLHELKDYEKVFLFTTFPEHKGRHEKGSAVLAEIIKSYNPRVVLIAGKERKHEFIGKSLLVSTGSLAEGKFTLVNLRKQEVITSDFSQSVRVA